MSQVLQALQENGYVCLLSHCWGGMPVSPRPFTSDTNLKSVLCASVFVICEQLSSPKATV